MDVVGALLFHVLVEFVEERGHHNPDWSGVGHFHQKLEILPPT